MNYLWWILIAIVVILVIFGGKIRSLIYDFFIINMTESWYREVLNYVPNDAKILDVGIGTGTALLRNKKKVIDKNVSIVGVDIDKDYVVKCKASILKEDMEKYISVRHENFYDYQPDKPVDVVYFSASLMLMPDPVKALKHAEGMLSENGRIYSTQTFEEKKKTFSWKN